MPGLGNTRLTEVVFVPYFTLLSTRMHFFGGDDEKHDKNGCRSVVVA